MTQIHFYAGSQTHHVNHMAPIYLGLPVEMRGRFTVRRDTLAEKRAKQLGIRPEPFRISRAHEYWVTASYEDYRVTRPAKVIYLNHGVGQWYNSERPYNSYSGGPDRKRVVLFIGPSKRDADMNRREHPEIPSLAVGVPYLDQFVRKARPVDGPVVVSFHANIRAVPETHWAWPHFKDAVVALKDKYDLLGHAHPRARKELEAWYRKMRIRFEPELWECLKVARCYVIDNSSSGYEMAALGVPVVWMNAPEYRRDVEHGLRFWSHVPGIQVDEPEQLEAAIKLALTSPPDVAKALEVAYSGLVDGYSTKRAVEAICQLIHDSETSPSPSSTLSLQS